MGQIGQRQRLPPLQPESRHRQLRVRIRRIPNRLQLLPQLPVTLHQHALLVGERVETGLPVVLPHPARPHAPEGQPLRHNLRDDLIHSHAPRRRALQDQLPVLAVLREDVQRQRLLPGVDEVDGLLDALHGDDGEDRAEDLLLHDGAVGVDVGEDGGGDEAVLGVGLAADGDLVALEEVLEALEMAVGDDAAEVWGGAGIVAVEFFEDLARRGEMKASEAEEDLGGVLGTGGGGSYFSYCLKSISITSASVKWKIKHLSIA